VPVIIEEVKEVNNSSASASTTMELCPSLKVEVSADNGQLYLCSNNSIDVNDTSDIDKLPLTRELFEALRNNIPSILNHMTSGSEKLFEQALPDNLKIIIMRDYACITKREGEVLKQNQEETIYMWESAMTVKNTELKAFLEKAEELGKLFEKSNDVSTEEGQQH
jgi:hypothetical protein